MAKKVHKLVWRKCDVYRGWAVLCRSWFWQSLRGTTEDDDVTCLNCKRSMKKKGTSCH